MNFENESLDLYIIVTMTNWSEPPRIRHEVAYQLSKNNNVLFVQLHSQRKYKRSVKKINPNLIVTKAGVSFPGMYRFFWSLPYLRYVYYKYIISTLRVMLKNNKYKKLALINFQYDFPEFFDLNPCDVKVYFCNDDFINQQLDQSVNLKMRKKKIQSALVSKSDLVITVSEPLKSLLSNDSENVKVVYSGHSFNLEKSLLHSNTSDGDIIRVCYLGFLNPGVALDWFIYILSKPDIKLTVIGPLPNKTISVLIKFNNFTHIPYLTDISLQQELLDNDVLLMPYSSQIENVITSVPAKLFQYLAVGKPIVSSVMHNLISLPNGFVYMAKNEDEFYNLIITSFNEDNESLRLKRINFASNNSWDARGIEIKKYIDEVIR